MINKDLQKRNYVIIFLIFSYSFLTGVFLTNIYNNFIVYIFLLIILISIQLIFYFKEIINLIFIWLIWFLIWIFLSIYNLNSINIKEDFLIKQTNNFTKKIDIKWKVKYNYSQDENLSSYLISIIDLNWNKINFDINLIIKVNKKSFLQTWDIVAFNSKIIKPENIDNFEYDKYLLLKNVYGTSYVYNFILVWNEIWIYDKFIVYIKTNFLNIINSIYPKDTAPFLWWILIWTRSELSKELKNNFNRSWLTHIVAVSGFNITIIITFFTFLLKYFPYQLRIIFITCFVIIFTSIVWDQISVIRASIMWLIAYYFLNFGKKVNSFNFLVLLVIIFTLINPLTLNYDISFHLSFLAVLWILYTQDFFKKIFYFITDKFSIKEALIMTFSALSFTLPIVITNFWLLSIISPLTNLLVTPFIPLIMLFWIISVVCYLIYPIIWILVWFLAWICTKYVLLIINYFWSLSFSVISIDLWVYKYIAEMIYFIILIFLILFFKDTKK